MKKITFKKWIKIIAGITFCFLMIFPFILKSYVKSETEIAEVGELQNTIKADGFVVRDEEIIYANSDLKPSIKYLLSDGEKVSKNGYLAEVYSSDTGAKASYKTDFINKEIEVLEKLNSCKYNYSQSINSINDKINEKIEDLSTHLKDSSVNAAENARKEILYLLNEKQIILEKNVDFENKIKKLNEEKESLKKIDSKVVSEIKSPESGDFISHIDNFEGKFNYKNLKFTDFTDFDPENVSCDNELPENSEIGKIIKSPTWYIVTKISKEKAESISMDSEVKLSVEGLEFIKNIPGKVETIKKDTDKDMYTLLISCEYMNKNIATLRNEEFKIDFESYSGLKINKNAVHQISGMDENSEEKQFGAYVVVGNYLKFKKINPIFWGDKEVVCHYTHIEENNEDYLQMGDMVVVNGTDLYDGKRVM